MTLVARFAYLHQQAKLGELPTKLGPEYESPEGTLRGHPVMQGVCRLSLRVATWRKGDDAQFGPALFNGALARFKR